MNTADTHTPPSCWLDWVEKEGGGAGAGRNSQSEAETTADQNQDRDSEPDFRQDAVSQLLVKRS